MVMMVTLKRGPSSAPFTKRELRLPVTHEAISKFRPSDMAGMGRVWLARRTINKTFMPDRPALGFAVIAITLSLIVIDLLREIIARRGARDPDKSVLQPIRSSLR